MPPKDDDLLTSLCQICHIQPPKYTCPRCSQRTCSLPCSKRHKLWANCNGVRDPTVYKPISQVATPSGIDHDYNFLHGIEIGRERAVREVVDRKGLVSEEELKRARMGLDDNEGRRGRGRGMMRKEKESRGEIPLRKAFAEMEIRVRAAPKQMKRNAENATNWSKNQKCVNWTVEWVQVREGSAATRILSKTLDRHPIGSVFADLLEEERRKGLNEEERRLEKKRKAEEIKARGTKKAKMEVVAANVCSACAVAAMQDPANNSWSLVPASMLGSATAATTSSTSADTQHSSSSSQSEQQHLSFYLHRPCTPSSFPKVLIPIDASQPLSQLLRKRLVLEFPTVYVFDNREIDRLPEEFMPESEYMEAVGERAAPPENEESDTETSGEEGESESETSSSGSSSDEDEDEGMEDGEVDELRVYA
ncbi:hypothetical protein F5884DRAFT_775503 [Xylogone sp. PMI_703]|nr:hypothetical protein F5884DRAFT_775503 [Xylogone sp. PMI_703]